MTSPVSPPAAAEPVQDVSLFALGTLLLRHRMRIARWAIAGGVVAALLVIGRPRLYQASASFTPAGTEGARSSLATLAGQFGLAVPASNASQSTDFYQRLLRSRVLLRPIVRDTFVVAEEGGRRAALLDLLKIDASLSRERREELGVGALSEILGVGANKATNIVDLSVVTRWRSVSQAIAERLVAGVNDFNRRARQVQAATEREFIEGRLALAGTELRAAEDRLERFLRANRVNVSPELTFERERLQRAVNLQQQVFTSLTQAYEESRIREVRDTPVITVIEQPEASTIAEPRRRLLMALLGVVLGAAIGIALTFVRALMERRRDAGYADADEFLTTGGEVIGTIMRPVRRARERLKKQEREG